MQKVILNLLFLTSIFAYSIYLKKKRKKAIFLKIGRNYKLIFTKDTKQEIHKINIILDKFIAGISNLSGIKHNVPDISYCHWINGQGEKIGTTFLIKEDEASQYEMYYSEFLKIINEIVEITEEQDFEIALNKYFGNLSKNIVLVSIQFEDLLIKLDVQYEKITGI